MNYSNIDDSTKSSLGFSFRKDETFYNNFINNYKSLKSRDEELFKDYKDFYIDNYKDYKQFNNPNNQMYKETVYLFKEEMNKLLKIYTNKDYDNWDCKINLLLIKRLLKMDYYKKYRFDEQLDLLIYPGQVANEYLSHSICYLIMIIILSFMSKKDIRNVDNMTFLEPEYFIFKDKKDLKIVSVYEMINIIHNKLIIRFGSIGSVCNNFDTFINKTFFTKEYNNTFGIKENVNYFELN